MKKIHRAIVVLLLALALTGCAAQQTKQEPEPLIIYDTGKVEYGSVTVLTGDGQVTFRYSGEMEFHRDDNVAEVIIRNSDREEWEGE